MMKNELESYSKEKLIEMIKGKPLRKMTNQELIEKIKECQMDEIVKSVFVGILIVFVIAFGIAIAIRSVWWS